MLVRLVDVLVCRYTHNPPVLSLVDDVLDILTWILGCIAPRDSAAGASWIDIY